MATASMGFILSLVVSLVLTPCVRRAAVAAGAVDRAGNTSRKVHTRAVPRLGGVAIAAAFYLPLLSLLVVDSRVGRLFTADMSKVMGLLVGGAAIVALGLYDDLRGANAPKKFAVQFATAAMLYSLGFKISVISTPFGVSLDLGSFDLLITLLFIVGVINALNLVDGLDGLASGIAFAAAGTTLAIAILSQNVLMVLFMAVLTGAILGFLVYNFNPASIFMGDTGSMFLGYVIAVTSIQTNTKGSATVALLVPVMALGLPILDTFLAMARRFIRGQSMFRADKEHIHHRMLDLGLSHRRVVLLLYGFASFLGAAAITITMTSGLRAAAVLAVAVAVSVVFLRRLGFLSLHSWRRGAESLTRLRRHNLAVRETGRQVAGRLNEAENLEDLWIALKLIPEPMGVWAMRLRISADISAGGIDQREYVWESGRPAVPELDRRPAFIARYEIAASRAPEGTLELTWTDGRNALPRDDEIAIEVLLDTLKSVVDRLARGPQGVIELSRSPRERNRDRHGRYRPSPKPDDLAETTDVNAL